MAIIGAGVTGVLVAHELLQRGLTVVMVDKREPGFGSTAASTGLLLYQVDTSLGELSRRHGRAAARRVYQLGRQAIRQLGTLSRTLGLDCGWATKPTLYVASRSRDVAHLEREARRSRQIGFVARQVTERELARRFGLLKPAALESRGSAEVDALALTRGVLRRCLRHPRFRLFVPSKVRQIVEWTDGVQLRLADGRCLDADHAIVASGYEARQFISTPIVHLRSTYVIASRPFSPEALRPLRCLMWETARPYSYLRTTRDRRIVFGGLDDPFTNPSRRDRRLAMKTRQLEQAFASWYPALAFRAEYAWTGTFADTVDGLPCIGPARRGARVFYALGYSGNGITFSQIAAKILSALCRRKHNRDARLFAVNRGGHRAKERGIQVVHRARPGAESPHQLRLGRARA